MPLPPDIDFAKDRDASPARMNQAMTHLDGRLRALETPRGQYDAMLLQLQQIGLQRINDALQPVYAQLVGLANIGAVFSAHSSTQLAPALGEQTFVVDDTVERARFAPMPWVAAIATDDPTHIMSGTFVSYDRDTGALVILVQAAIGDGIVSNWTLMPAVPMAVPAAIDPGFYDGTPQPQQQISFSRGIVADPGTF